MTRLEYVLVDKWCRLRGFDYENVRRYDCFYWMGTLRMLVRACWFWVAAAAALYFLFTLNGVPNG